MQDDDGPTLNPEYNDLLRRWAASGDACEPECEECSCDLAGGLPF